MIRVASSLILGTLALLALNQTLHAQDSAQSLKIYAVHIIEGPNDVTSGNGVYLGSGFVLTAAHVAAAVLQTIKVAVGPQRLPAGLVKRGEFLGVDLALLSIEDGKLPTGLRLRRMPLCKKPPWPGEQIIVATPEAVAQSHVIEPFLLPHDLDPKFRTAISDVDTTGNSGSGVFDLDEGCLQGIISAKIREVRRRPGNGQATEQSYNVAKYFVPSPVIAEFIGPVIRK